MYAELAISFALIVDERERADKLLSSLLGISRNRLQQNMARDTILLNGVPLRKPGFKKFKRGDVIEAEIAPLEQLTLEPEPIPLIIVFEDNDILVVNKPAGLVVHPAPGHYHGTLMNGVVAYLGNGSDNSIRPGLVHRIDKDTSGLLVIAKHSESFEQLVHLFAVHAIDREYKALVWGCPKSDSGTIESGHARDRSDRRRFYPADDAARRAITHWKVERCYRGISLLSVTLETGRTHQIRMHMKMMGHPVVNDPLYSGVRKSALPGIDSIVRKSGRHFLHAATLGFTINNRHYFFSSELPKEFSDLIELLERL